MIGAVIRRLAVVYRLVHRSVRLSESPLVNLSVHLWERPSGRPSAHWSVHWSVHPSAHPLVQQSAEQQPWHAQVAPLLMQLLREGDAKVAQDVPFRIEDPVTVGDATLVDRTDSFFEPQGREGARADGAGARNFISTQARRQ